LRTFDFTAQNIRLYLLKNPMLMNKRLINAAIILVIIGVGLGSRLFSSIPGSVGDILYAAMFFFILRTILMNSSRLVLSLMALLFCYAVEFSNFIDVSWLNDFRETTLGKLSLGSGFLWSDLWAYFVGIVLAWYIDSRVNP